MSNKEILAELKKHPNNNLKEVANITGIDLIKIKKAQLQMTKRCIKRDSPLWDLQKYCL